MATEEKDTRPESERLGDIESRRAKPWLPAAIVTAFSATGSARGLALAAEGRDPRPGSERLGDSESRRAKPWLLAAIVIVFSAIGIVLGLLIDWMPTQASTQLDSINTLYDVLIIASVPIFVLVQGYVIYAIWRWRMRKGEEEKDGPPIHGNTRLEVIWTIIPAVMMLILTTYSYIVLKDIEETPAKAQNELVVRTVGEQFTWTFYYAPEQEG